MKELARHEYYLLGTSLPIRVSYDDQNRARVAHGPHPRTGTLVNQTTEIIRAREDGEPISEKTFWNKMQQAEEALRKLYGIPPRQATPNIENTVNLIKGLHWSQTDQTGNPYYLHPMRVASNVKWIDSFVEDDVVKAALLHDTIEDCAIDHHFLLEEGYSKACVAMVRLVTKPADDTRSYDQVIDDLVQSGNKGAMLVKLADNMDNLHPARVAAWCGSNPEKAKRLGSRYKMSIAKLSQALGIDQPSVLRLVDHAEPLDAFEDF